MKPNLSFTYHSVIFLVMTFLLTPPKVIRMYGKVNETKIEKKQQVSVARENTTEILHGELLFKF